MSLSVSSRVRRKSMSVSVLVCFAARICTRAIVRECVCADKFFLCRCLLPPFYEEEDA